MVKTCLTPRLLKWIVGNRQLHRRESLVRTLLDTWCSLAKIDRRVPVSMPAVNQDVDANYIFFSKGHIFVNFGYTYSTFCIDESRDFDEFVTRVRVRVARRLGPLRCLVLNLLGPIVNNDI